MIKKYRNIKSIILPNKKINIFVICILFLGLIAGSVFASIINYNDKTMVVEKIKLFIDNINNNSVNSILAFKNSISINLLYVAIIWLLGIALIGIIFSVIFLFIKSFIFGFSIASFIITYSFKGILLSFLYLTFGQLLNIIVILILTIYSIMFSINLIEIIIQKKVKKNNKFLKKYIIILLFSVIVSFISSISEVYLFPNILKIIISLYTKA